MHKNVIETIVGMIVLMLCGLFVYVVYSTGNLNKASTNVYLLNAEFERADGIELGSNVSISGVTVGKVISKKLDAKSYSAIVAMHVDKAVELPVDTSAEIISNGLLGSKYVSLVPGIDTEMLKDSAFIEFTQASLNLETMIGKLMFGLENSRGKDETLNNKNENEDNIDDNADDSAENSANHKAVFKNENMELNIKKENIKKEITSSENKAEVKIEGKIENKIEGKIENKQNNISSNDIISDDKVKTSLNNDANNASTKKNIEYKDIILGEQANLYLYKYNNVDNLILG